ncbi:uncharacterized protein isoform X2 [Rhodnius prolixus]|uniref:uncharacterized protein isoform X2 n=1 Tax=Rhodnius prolixus TaxID=13249 RepID=UPI003D188A12
MKYMNWFRLGIIGEQKDVSDADQSLDKLSPEDGNGPIYGSLIETSKLKSDGDVYDKDRDDKSCIYNSLPSTPTQCPSCLRDYQEEADDCRKTPDTIYEDILMKTAMERRRRRIRLNKIQQAQQIDPKFGMNTLGHLRIDYSGNWNKLDRYICHP